ncbi:MAG: toprim domain-containing protein [Patescibacteria group bacterium]
MDSPRRLEEIFAHFPGIGPRQARRFVYYLMNKPPAFIKEFVQLIEEVKKSTSECEMCHKFFTNTSGSSRDKSKTLICGICSDQNRDQTILMIVARDSDFESIEKSGAYKGLYFILGGSVPVLDKEPEKRIRLKSLLERISSDISKNSKSISAADGQSPRFQEIILSLNTTPDGEHTATIVRDAISNITAGKQIKITILGRGLSTGAELEYADSDTIRNALKNRA